MTTTPAAIAPRLTLIELDETQHLEGYPNEVKAFFVCYLFDRNLITRICSQDKHYFLDPVYVNVDFHDHVSEERREEIQGELVCELGEADYYPEPTVEAWIAEGKARIDEYDPLDPEHTDAEAFEAAREYYQSNCAL